MTDRTTSNNNNCQQRRPHPNAGKVCTHCGLAHHTAEECFKKFPHLKAAHDARIKASIKATQDAKNAKAQAAPKPPAQTQSHANFNTTAEVPAAAPHQFGHSVGEGAVLALRAAHDAEAWVVDSGAPDHMTNNRKCLITYSPCDTTIHVGKGSIKAIGYGNARVATFTTTGGRRDLTFTAVLYAPELAANLLSTQALVRKKCFYRNDLQVLFIKSAENDCIPVADVYVCVYHGLPHLTKQAIQLTALAFSSAVRIPHGTMEQWHLRLGHMHERKIVTLHQRGVIVIDGSHHLPTCVACRVAHAQLVHSRIPATRLSVVYMLYVLTQTGIAIPVYRLDGCKEYGVTSLHQWAVDNGIRLEVTPPHQSTINGRAEVSNHIVCTLARKMMLHANLPVALWPEAVRAAVRLLNLTPSTSLDSDCPHQVLAKALNWTATHKPFLAELRAYGCPAVVHDTTVARGAKFDSRGIQGQLVGYEGPVYRVWLPLQHKVVRSSSVTFSETGDLVEPMGAASEADENDVVQFLDHLIETNDSAVVPLPQPGGDADPAPVDIEDVLEDEDMPAIHQ
ncbi:hypothetical protein TI39_contig4419g00006 [Zymoseptoria brevis]|uniref:Integrase catalytic domain-containing protein n=1 Tax=Zymoseptoria brevis TaxID=1047168 RepID=A0A0F4G6T8_9PEZI|nr:hypothetical protein TI39_contig4419g00006 [Zymoseptoria brevis]